MKMQWQVTGAGLLVPYPERATTADVYKAESACMMVGHLLVEVAHLIGYRG